MANGLKNAECLEYLDLQYNGMEDRHGDTVCKIIKEQYAHKGALRWRLGLRNGEYFNISTIGLKSINLSKNNFGDKFISQLAETLSTDEYVKCIALKQNNIGPKGFKMITNIAADHRSLLSMDMRNNPGFEESEDCNEIMKYGFLKNIRAAIRKYYNDGTRIKLEWIYPNALGQYDNQLDEMQPAMDPQPNRELFVKLIQEISDNIEIPFNLVTKAIIGAKSENQNKLRRKIIDVFDQVKSDGIARSR